MEILSSITVNLLFILLSKFSSFSYQYLNQSLFLSSILLENHQCHSIFYFDLSCPFNLLESRFIILLRTWTVFSTRFSAGRWAHWFFAAILFTYKKLILQNSFHLTSLFCLWQVPSWLLVIFKRHFSLLFALISIFLIILWLYCITVVG